MISVTFGGYTVGAYQASKVSITTTTKETPLLSGDIHASLSSKTQSFPRSFDCYTADYSEIETLEAQIGSFDVLIIDGTSYSNCYISSLGDIHEIRRGSGKYTYSIQFKQADVY